LINRDAVSGDKDAELEAVWTAALRGDREAFQRAVRPYLRELLRTARHEVRYRTALGDFEADDPTPEELVGEVLVRAWRERQNRLPHLRLRVWLLTLLYRVADSISRSEDRRKRVPTESLEEPPPPEPIYDDDEEFWEWYQPDEVLRREDVVEARTMTPEEEAGTDEELTRTLDPRVRVVFLLCELHRVPLAEAAVALGMPLEDAARLFEEARRDLGLGGDKNLI
jgi:DNA-directed RNA polymerase specialized sigma24 family protein